MPINGSMAKDTDTMASWGIADIVGTVVDNYAQQEEHKREMDRLEKIANIEYIKTEREEMQESTNPLSSINKNTVIGAGAVAGAVYLAYRVLK